MTPGLLQQYSVKGHKGHAVNSHPSPPFPTHPLASSLIDPIKSSVLAPLPHVSNRREERQCFQGRVVAVNSESGWAVIAVNPTTDLERLLY